MQEHVPLRDKTTLQTGGTARFFCSVSTEQNLKTAFLFSREKELPVVILGGGSNVLLSDKELNAVVVQNAIRGIEWNSEPPLFPSPLFREGIGGGVLVIAGAGENWDTLVAEAVRRGLWGIENLSGIPGTVGGAPVQNIGAYGAELKDVLAWVETFDAQLGKVRRLENAECGFQYRDSIFKHPEGKSLIVTRVALRLKKNGVPNLEYKDLKNYFTASYSPFPKGSTRSGRDLHPPSLTFSKKRGTPPCLPIGGQALREEELNPTLQEIREAVLEIRSKKFPDLKQFGTAGSFFKNPVISQEKFAELKKRYRDLPGFPVRDPNQRMTPECTESKRQLFGSFGCNSGQLGRVKVPLAWILDSICGLKGYRKGNIELFENQPIVLVNIGGASAQEIEAFAETIASRVREKTGIEIQWEVEYLK